MLFVLKMGTFPPLAMTVIIVPRLGAVNSEKMIRDDWCQM